MNLITTTNGQPMTTSRVLAEKFGKRHKNVLQAIRNMECSDAFRRLNFQPTIFDVAGPKGAVRREECFDITRDGFSFLAMGFTGKEAANWKEKFITAFYIVAFVIIPVVAFLWNVSAWLLYKRWMTSQHRVLEDGEPANEPEQRSCCFDDDECEAVDAADYVPPSPKATDTEGIKQVGFA